jgi:hypothetical protein
MHPQNQCPVLRGIGLVGMGLGLACAAASAVTKSCPSSYEAVRLVTIPPSSLFLDLFEEP